MKFNVEKTAAWITVITFGISLGALALGLAGINRKAS